MVLTSVPGGKRKAAAPPATPSAKTSKVGNIKSKTSSRDKGLAKNTTEIYLTCAPGREDDVPVFVVGIGFKSGANALKFLAACFCYSVLYWNSPENTRYRSGWADEDIIKYACGKLYTSKRSDTYDGDAADITDPILLLLGSHRCYKAVLVPCATIVQVKAIESIVNNFVAANRGWILHGDVTLRRDALRLVRTSHSISPSYELYTWSVDGNIIAAGISSPHMRMMNDSLLANLSDAAVGTRVGDTALHHGVNANGADTGDLLILDGDKTDALRALVEAAGFILNGDVQTFDVGAAVVAADDEASVASQDA